MTKKMGLKEAALKLMREETLEVPAFLKREETPEQAEKRRKKHQPKDSTGGLKVIEPVAPTPEKIRKAIEKDLKEDVAALTSDDIMNSWIANKKPTKLTDLAKQKKAGKLPPVLKKALAEKDKLENLTKTPMESDVKKAKTKTTKTKVKKQATNGAAAYWTKAEADAKAGKLPALPPFSSYKDHAEKFLALAKKNDMPGIRKYSGEHKNETGTRANLFRFRDLLVKAMRVIG